MYLQSYVYKTGKKSKDSVLIPKIDRNGYTYIELAGLVSKYITKLEVGEKVALLYVGGPAIHHSDSRVVKGVYTTGSIVVKSQLGYGAYSIARMINGNVDYVSINTNTCASSMYAIYEAKKLLADSYTDVIIYGADMVDEAQKLLFEQIGIDLVCGDGVAVLHFSNKESKILIDDAVWKWNRDSSPMTVSSEGYEKVLNELDTSDIDLVKTHGSGTDRNTQEEDSAIRKVLGSVNLVEYKSEIGHTQGVSTIIELCMLIEREKFDKAIVLVSGLGGFYGGCVVKRVDNDNKKDGA